MKEDTQLQSGFHKDAPTRVHKNLYPYTQIKFWDQRDDSKGKDASWCQDSDTWPEFNPQNSCDGEKWLLQVVCARNTRTHAHTLYDIHVPIHIFSLPSFLFK